MSQRLINILAFAAAALAIIVGAIFSLGKNTFLVVYIAFFLLALLSAWLLGVMFRDKRLREWCAAQGTIQSCDFDSSFKQTQNYRCAYVFWPGEVRQGGTFLISESFSDPDERLDEIRKVLIGCTVQVRYDPKDCTRCMVEDKQVMSWDVVND